MALETHPQRIARLHAEVDGECIKRWEKIAGAKWTEAERIVHYSELANDGYRRSREIENGAAQHWRNLETVLRQCADFLTAHDADDGAFKAAKLAFVVPKISKLLDHSEKMVATSGAAAFSDKPPSRRTFIRDRLWVVAQTRGFADPFEIRAQDLAVLTLLAGFWPFTTAAERQFEKNGYPQPYIVIRKETETVRKLTVY